MSETSLPTPSPLENPARFEPARFVLGLLLVALASGMAIGILLPREPLAPAEAVAGELDWRKEVIYAEDPQDVFRAYQRTMERIKGNGRSLAPGQYALGWVLASLILLGGLNLLLLGARHRARVPALCPRCGVLVLARPRLFTLMCPKGQHDVGWRPGRVLAGIVAVATAAVTVAFLLRALL